MRSNTPFARTLALGLSAAVITVAAGTAASAAPAGVVKKLTAALRVNSAAPAVGSPVQVDVHGTKLPKHDKVKSITVSFGDHTKAVHLKTLKGSTKHSYAQPGTYTVTVTIVDKHGKRSVKTKKIVVHAKPTTPTGPTPPVAHTFPVVVPATATPTTTLGSILSADQLAAVATQLVTPANLLATLPVGYLGLLPASELSLPPNGLPRLPGLVDLNLAFDLLGQLSYLTGLPINVPTSGVKLTTPIGQVPLISFAQRGTLGALYGVPAATVGQLPLVALFLLPTALLHAGAPATVGLPITIPVDLDPTATVQDLLDLLGLSGSDAATIVNEIASLTSTPPAVLPGLPVGYLELLKQLSPTSINDSAHPLPQLPFDGIDATQSLVNLLAALLTDGLHGFPLSLPNTLDLTQSLGSLPTSDLSATQAASLAKVFNVDTATLAQLPVQAVNLLPSGLFAFVAPSGGGGGGGGGVTLPLPIPTGLDPTSTVQDVIDALSVPADLVGDLATGLGVSTDVLPQLPVAVLKALPASLVTLPVDLPTLPGLDGLSLVNLIAQLVLKGLTGLPVTIPSDFDVTNAIGSLPSQAESASTLTSMATLFGVPVSVLDQLPVSLLQNTNVVPGALVTVGGTIASYLPPAALPLDLVGKVLNPSTLISSLGLSDASLSAVAALLGIAPSVLATLPVGFLKLLPAADVPNVTLPALPGLAGLPLIGGLTAILAGLPLNLTSVTNTATLIGALASPLSLTQLSIFAAYFGISTSTLSNLPVSVLTLLPTGYITGLL